MAEATKKLVVLPPNLVMTAITWYQFVGDAIEADQAMIRKLRSGRSVILNALECSILVRWWNYLSPTLIDPSDEDLYELATEFAYE